MQKAYIFVDESGKPDYTDKSGYFCLSAIVIKDKNRIKLRSDLETLKQKYFGNKNFVIHGNEIKRTLRIKGKDEAEFAKDLRTVVLPIGFFALCTITSKSQAKNGNWIKDTILKKSYRTVLTNLIEFVIAKNFRGHIIAEASAQEQDLHLYRNFFHFLSNGIPQLKISSQDVKNHVTSIMYVTKQNEDCEEQLVDLLAGVIPLKYLIERNKLNETNVSEFDRELLKILENKLFVANANGQNIRKKQLYKSITSYKKFP